MRAQRVGVGHLDLRHPHLLGALGGQDARAVRRHAVSQVQLREGQRLPCGGVDQAGRSGRAEDPPDGSDLQLLAGWGHVARGGAVQQRLLGQRARTGQAERRKQPLAEHGIPRRTTQDLDQPAQHDVAGVAVGHRRAERVVLLEVRARGDVLLHAVVTTAGVEEEVAVDATGVSQQVPGRHGLGHVDVGDLELGQVLDHRLVEVEQALVDELHDQGRGPHLGDRPDLEQRVGRCLDLSADVEDAVRRVRHLAVGEDRQARAGHAVLVGEQREPLLPVLDVDRHGPSVAQAGSSGLVRESETPCPLQCAGPKSGRR